MCYILPDHCFTRYSGCRLYAGETDSMEADMRDTNDPGIKPALKYLEKCLEAPPKITFILGSGLGKFVDELENPSSISAGEIPGYPESTVPGHEGRLVCGTICGEKVLAVQGRVHYYEGYPIETVVMPVRIAAALGTEAMIITHAAGCIGDHLEPGDLMAITDHVNLMGTSPLIGQRWGYNLFPDMSKPYHPELVSALKIAAIKIGFGLKTGVLSGVHGPNYETPAEIKYMKTIGIDAVCMSTVPEVIAAARLNLKVCGVSCITNYAAGLSPKPLSHNDVIAVTAKMEKTFRKLLRQAVCEISQTLNK